VHSRDVRAIPWDERGIGDQRPKASRLMGISKAGDVLLGVLVKDSALHPARWAPDSDIEGWG